MALLQQRWTVLGAIGEEARKENNKKWNPSSSLCDIGPVRNLDKIDRKRITRILIADYKKASRQLVCVWRCIWRHKWRGKTHGDDYHADYQADYRVDHIPHQDA